MNKPLCDLPHAGLGDMSANLLTPASTRGVHVPNMNLLQPDQARIVASLALACHIPVMEMATLYEHERAELALGARITKYLHIFAIRNVLEAIDRRHLFGLSGHSERPAGLAI